MQNLEYDYFGLVRELPLRDVKGGTIAYFDSVGDKEVLMKASRNIARFADYYAILDRRPDYIVTTETKGIPIAKAVGGFFNIPVIVLRKSSVTETGDYHFTGESITSGKTTYFVPKSTVKKLQSATVWFIDDVFSTGGTMRVVKQICDKNNARLTFGGFIMNEVPAKEMPLTMRVVDKERMSYFEFDGITCFATAVLPMVVK